MAYDPDPLDKGFASTKKMGAEGTLARQTMPAPAKLSVLDPTSGVPLQKGRPVPNAGPFQPETPAARAPYHRNPRVKVDAGMNAINPLSYGPGTEENVMKKGRPVTGPARTPAELGQDTALETLRQTYHFGTPKEWAGIRKKNQQRK